MEPRRYIGATTTLAFRCLRKGTIAIEMLDLAYDSAFGSGLITGIGEMLQAVTHGATVKCAGEPYPRVPSTLPSGQRHSDLL